MPTSEESGKEPPTRDDDDLTYDLYEEATRGVKESDKDAEDFEIDEADIVDIDLDDLVAMEGPDA